MYITFARSSSLGDLAMCEQKYFLKYNLGLKDDENVKATLGTITHKVLELLAHAKLIHQETGKTDIKFTDDALGAVEFDYNDLFIETKLSNEEVDKINKSRINKSIYKHKSELNYGHIRRGHKLVNSLIIRSYNHYVENSSKSFTRADFRCAGNWTWMAMEQSEGAFNPLVRNIVLPEKHFSIPIEQDWAKYTYTFPDGTTLDGQLAIKVTIDLTTRIDDNTLEIVDWKTGQRLNWATGEEKTYEKLHTDTQLLLYYYAASKLFPGENVIMTIYFIRDGGPFSLCFDQDKRDLFENLLKKKFEHIKATIKPKMLDPRQRDFRCTKLCYFYKNNNQCKEIHDFIEEHGMDKAIIKYKDPSFELDYYEAPG